MEPSVFSGRVASLAVIASLVLQLSGASMAAESRVALPSTPATDRTLSRRIGFEANCGQVDEHVQFVARGAAYTAFLTSTEAVLALGDRRGEHAVLRMERIGANAGAQAAGSGPLPGVVSYFPDGRVDSPVSAPAYRRVRYDDVYPGIDLVYYSHARRLEYDFVVAPGVDPNQIGLRIDGAERVDVDGEGTLVMHTAAGDVRQPRPVAYQRIGGVRRPVTADYALDAEGRVRLRLGAYDRSRRLVIDPVITYATYLGGTGDEAQIYFDGEVHLARDGAGNLYVTGTTRSTDFPTTPGAARTLNGSADVFVTKLSPGGAVLYSTYLGGPCEDYGRAIAVDGAGNAYVTGEVNGGGTCVSTPGVLVAKLDPNGNLVYASRLGGSLVDSSYGTGIAVDAEGHAYVTGVAITSDFPTTPGAYPDRRLPQRLPLRGRRIRRQAERRRQRARLLDAPLRPGRRLALGHRDRRGRKRVRRGDHGVERLPARRPDRAGARRRCHRSQRVRLEAEPRRVAAPLLDVPWRLGERRDQRHRARRGGERLRDRRDGLDGLPDHARRDPGEGGTAALHRGLHRRLRREDRARAGPRSCTRRTSTASSTTRATRSRSTAPATRTSWARPCRYSSRSSTRSSRASAISTTRSWSS